MYSNSKSVSIEDIDNFLYDDEEKTRTAHKGVFSGCVGDFSVEYLNATWTARELEKLIIDEYKFRSISFETWQEFFHHVKITWNRYFAAFAQSMQSEIPNFTFENEKEEISGSSSNTTQTSTSSNTNSKYTDTPNQYHTESDNFNGLTNETINSGSGSGNSSGSGSSSSTRTKTYNSLLQWLAVSEKNYNLVYSFVDKFAPLMLETVRIY